MLITKLTSWLRARFTVAPSQVESPVVSAAAPPAAPVAAKAAPEPPPIPGRPQSAVEILRNEPNLDAATLAARAGVTLSYAKSLIRRRQAKAFVAPVRAATQDGSVALLQSQVRALARRMDYADDCLTAPQVKLSRRGQVLDRQAAGVSSNRIAEELAMPTGEVDFILKIDRLKKSVKN